MIILNKIKVHRNNHKMRWSLLSFMAAIMLGTTLNVGADTRDIVDFNIKPQTVASALVDFGVQGGVTVGFSDEVVSGHNTRGISGVYPVVDALAKLLDETGLSFQVVDGKTISISKVKTVSGEDVGALNNTGKEIEKNRDYEVEEIIVTAQKREQNIMDVPIAITALGGDQMAKAGITDLQSLSFAVPGLTVAENGSIQRTLTIRGIGNTFGRSSLVGIYVDEASVTTSFPANQIDLRIHDVERIEVLKGPQGTLYGEGAVGGTIRYITRDPQLDGFAGNLSVDVSAIESGEPSQEVKSVLNVPLVENLGLRLVGQYVNSGGWIDQPALSKKDINSYELFNIRTKLLWQPSDRLEIKSMAILHRNDTELPNTGEDENGDFHQAFDDPSTPSTADDYDFYNITATYDIGRFNVISSTGYLDAYKKWTDKGSTCHCFVDPAVKAHFLGPPTQINNEHFTQEVRIATDGSTSWNWTAGLLYRDATYRISRGEGALYGVPGGTLGVDLFELGEFFEEENSRSWAVFGDTSYAITDRLEIGTGLRYYEDDRKLQAFRNGPFQSGKFESLNPKFYLSYAVTEDIRIYTNAAKGFRSGGFNFLGQPPFDPESVWSYELGAKMSLMEGRLSTEWALFYSDYDDYQIAGFIPSVGAFITSNAGEAEIQGIEASVRFFATDQLEVGFNSNYMDTKFVKVDATSSSFAVGDSLDMVPEYGISLWGHYAFSWPDGTPGFARLDYSQQGKSHYSLRNIRSDLHGTSDIIKMLNARIGWEHANWNIELYALNLMDEHGLTNPFEIVEGGSRPRPRTIGLNVGVKF